MKPLGHYANARSEHSDAAILERITEQFGSMLQDLTRDDKAAVLICLVEAAVPTDQVMIMDNFFSNQRGGELWKLAKDLSPSNQLALAAALLEYLGHGGQH
jgi:hypothetical protein